MPDLINRQKQMKQIRKEVLIMKKEIQKITIEKKENIINIEEQINLLDQYNLKIDDYQRKIKEIYNISNIGEIKKEKIQAE